MNAFLDTLTPHNLQTVSIAIEALIAVLAYLSARRGRRYMYGLALTFAIYVYYDAARLYGFSTPDGLLPFAFLVATLSALYAVWSLYRRSY